jgi:hypothetical protein
MAVAESLKYCRTNANVNRIVARFRNIGVAAGNPNT